VFCTLNRSTVKLELMFLVEQIIQFQPMAETEIAPVKLHSAASDCGSQSSTEPIIKKFVENVSFTKIIDFGEKTYIVSNFLFTIMFLFTYEDWNLFKIIHIIITAQALYFVLVGAVHQALEVILPNVPGYCYLSMISVGLRRKYAIRFGCNPVWGDFIDEYGVCADKEFDFSIAENVLHVWEVEDGYSVEQLTEKYQNHRVGAALTQMPMVKMALYLQPASRFLAWCYLVILSISAVWPVILFPIYWLAFSSRMDRVAVVSLVGLGSFLSLSWQMGLQMIIFYMISVVAANYTIRKMIGSTWLIPDVEPPTTVNYPEGDTPSGLTHDFTLHNRNSNFELVQFTEDENLIGEVREEFIKQTGLSNTRGKHTGTPHKLANLCGRFFRWSSQNHPTDLYPEYMVNIGGTFKGWPCGSSGIAFQPEFSDSDGYNLRTFPGRTGYGQMVVNDHIGTNTLPVGSASESFDPEWNVKGLGGARFWMTHCYDIPIKAVLACAYANNSTRVDIIMHAAPSVFTDRSGILPWSGQSFTHNDDGTTQWEWKGTTGRTWSHNSRIFFEHFLTDYIKVAENTWYVSHIPRQVMDVYNIVWIKTNKQPQRTPKRKLVLKLPPSDTWIPLTKGTTMSGVPEITGTATSKQVEEYIHTANDFEILQVNMRAIVDNFWRQRGIEPRYFTPEECLCIWEAELLRRDLLVQVIPVEELLVCWRMMLGLERDPTFTRKVCRDAVNLLTKQPRKVVVMPTICQDTKYVDCKVVREIPKRMFPMPSFSLTNGLIVQELFNNMQPVATVKLKGSGTGMASELCSLLFNSTTIVPPVLPMGRPEKGGSILAASGTNLLPTEIEYLTKLGVNFLVKSGGNVRHYGKHVAKIYPIVIHIDIDERLVTRIHYKQNVILDRLVKMFDGVAANLCDDITWIPSDGTGRAYAQHPQFQQYYKAKVTSLINDKLLKSNSTEARIELKQEIQDLQDLRLVVPVIIPPGTRSEEVPIIPNQNIHLDLYDGMNRLDEGLVPAHYYSAGTISDMLLLADTVNDNLST